MVMVIRVGALHFFRVIFLVFQIIVTPVVIVRVGESNDESSHANHFWMGPNENSCLLDGGKKQNAWKHRWEADLWQFEFTGVPNGSPIQEYQKNQFIFFRYKKLGTRFPFHLIPFSLILNSNLKIVCNLLFTNAQTGTHEIHSRPKFSLIIGRGTGPGWCGLAEYLFLSHFPLPKKSTMSVTQATTPPPQLLTSKEEASGDPNIWTQGKTKPEKSSTPSPFPEGDKDIRSHFVSQAPLQTKPL